MSSPSNSILPSPDKLNELEYGKFVLANLAAKRAKQLKDGAPPLVVIDSKHPLSIALAEIAAGKIRPILQADQTVAIETDEISLLDDSIGNELGILLPALDETEAELLVSDEIVMGEEGVDPDAELDGESSIADLLEDDLAEEVAAEPGDDTLSLSDIAASEEAGDDESED